MTKVPKGSAREIIALFPTFLLQAGDKYCCHPCNLCCLKRKKNDENDDDDRDVISCVNKATEGRDSAALLTTGTVVTIPSHDGLVLRLRHLAPGGG